MKSNNFRETLNNELITFSRLFVYFKLTPLFRAAAKGFSCAASYFYCIYLYLNPRCSLTPRLWFAFGCGT